MAAKMIQDVQTTVTLDTTTDDGKGAGTEAVERRPPTIPTAARLLLVGETTCHLPRST